MSEDDAILIKAQLDRIERCLVGDEQLGEDGLVRRVKDHGVRISRLEKWGMYIAGGGLVIAALYQVATDLLQLHK